MKPMVIYEVIYEVIYDVIQVNSVAPLGPLRAVKVARITHMYTSEYILSYFLCCPTG